MFQIQKITSRDNQKLKFVRAVREEREPDRIFIEGYRLAIETLKTNLPIDSAFINSAFLQTNHGSTLLESLIKKNVRIFELNQNLFDSISDTKNAQGIILIAGKPICGKQIIEQNLTSNPLVLLLHKLNNPSNLGAILRTAEAAGVNGIITTKGTTNVFSAKALRGGMGANLRIPFWVNTDFFEAIKWSKTHGFKSICADIRSQKSYLEINWEIPRLLIVGSEGHGLTIEERKMTDENLIIPMDNNVESLNVAVACGIILFEAKRQKEGNKSLPS